MAISPFNNVVEFKNWLCTTNLTYENFVLFFKNTNSDVYFSDNYPWIDYLVNSYVPAFKTPKYIEIPLGVLIDFIIEKATFEIVQKMQGNKHNNYIKPVILKKALVKELSHILSSIISPFLKLEYRLFCEPNKISGRTPDELCKDYKKQLTQKDYIISFFDEYPYLFNELIFKTTEISQDIYKLYCLLGNNYKSLCQCFGDLGTFNGYSNKVPYKSGTTKYKICYFEKKHLLYSKNPLKYDSINQLLYFSDKNHYWYEYI